MLKTNACPRPFPSEQRQQENTGRLLCGSSLNCLLSIVVLSVLGGCTFPDPTASANKQVVASSWPTLPDTPGGTLAVKLSWREYFTDPQLQKLIETALEHNQDLRVATLRTEEMRAAFRIQRAQQAPMIGVGMQQIRAGLPDSVQPLAGSSVFNADVASVGISSWELDFWGRVRDMKTSALEQWLATEQGCRAAQLSLITQVADAWLNLRELDERITLANRTVTNQQEMENIFETRLKLGNGSRLELTQVRTLLTQGKALKIQLELARAQQYNNLALLLGSQPNVSTGSTAFDENSVMPKLAPGLPSDLLQNRPDILAAEHALRARQANIAAARAAFFPRIALTAGAGTLSTDLNDLFSSGTGVWLFRPTLELPIFDAGMRRANLDLSIVRRDIAVAEYEHAIQSAFRDVANTLIARDKLAGQLSIAQEAQKEQIERVRLARIQFNAGSAAFLEVLDAERDLLAVEQQWVQTRRAVLSNQVALYAALGGGNEPVQTCASR
ncbi:RND transporter [Citrobacter freundii]|uniref:efflux transporter outer membrane subunit n=1 Tax=Citrobacter freundii TaxID=546 RepID=UPI000C8011D5|nr:efflux transporter outer membrane subunit [Citrobacter freundii]PMD03433.1 RND transporter [Citrobacter freundii]WLV36251.1 efflux transporter outer membrane subunit [Citrobacter freundii]